MDNANVTLKAKILYPTLSAPAEVDVLPGETWANVLSKAGVDPDKVAVLLVSGVEVDLDDYAVGGVIASGVPEVSAG